MFLLNRRYAVPGFAVLLSSAYFSYQLNMSSISKIRATNAAALSAKEYIPTAIFVGGTSGIGEGMAKAFAKHTEGNAHIIIVGRNRAAAESIISCFPKPTSPEAKHEFLQCDVALMQNIRSVSAEIRSTVTKINYLAMSPGFMTTSGRNETEEGMDRKLAVHYYSRWMFINELVTLLENAKERGEDAKALSVLAAGAGGPINVNDLGLKKTYSLKNAALQAPTYNDLMTEEFANRHPTITFAHAIPGAVRTNLFASAETSALTKKAMGLSMTLLGFLLTSPEDCGEYMLNGIVNVANAPGAWRIDSHGEDLGKKRYYGSEEERKKLWQHTVEATSSKS
ncbi:NAD(P)-binding protein [Lentinula boryana]|uniref:NAD(P)-binding protein n=1 Tax=Lentinula boryana TaxID=40481 RepID=A0ABQ8PZD5_9AGAR|nr:NAD(P)-binding protein [Lentinula boryana]